MAILKKIYAVCFGLLVLMTLTQVGFSNGTFFTWFEDMLFASILAAGCIGYAFQFRLLTGMRGKLLFLPGYCMSS